MAWQSSPGEGSFSTSLGEILGRNSITGQAAILYSLGPICLRILTPIVFIIRFIPDWRIHTSSVSKVWISTSSIGLYTAYILPKIKDQRSPHKCFDDTTYRHFNNNSQVQTAYEWSKYQVHSQSPPRLRRHFTRNYTDGNVQKHKLKICRPQTTSRIEAQFVSIETQQFTEQPLRRERYQLPAMRYEAFMLMNARAFRCKI